MSAALFVSCVLCAGYQTLQAGSVYGCGLSMSELPKEIALLDQSLVAYGPQRAFPALCGNHVPLTSPDKQLNSELSITTTTWPPENLPIVSCHASLDHSSHTLQQHGVTAHV